MAKATSMLLFMPWCKIDRPYKAGEITILPYDRRTDLPGLDGLARSRVDSIMGMYKSIEAQPVENAAIAYWTGKPLVDILTDSEIDIAYDLIDLVCFVGLSKRQYFGIPGDYCSTDCFILHVQRFSEADFVAFSSRRRAGRIRSGGWMIKDISITIPIHCDSIDHVTLDEELLAALIRERDEGDNWGRWQNAIACFNQANTDSSTFPHQVEWVLLCSAFEHLLSAKPEAKDVANTFADVLAPKQPLLVKDANRRSARWRDAGRPLRFEWMREFYRIRGDFAHGRLKTQQPVVWNPLEHLVLGTIAFPLVAKALLAQHGRYQMTTEDRVQIDCIEPFADTADFLTPPSDRKNSGDSHWNRLYRKRKFDIKLDETVDKLAKKLEERHPEFFKKETERNSQ